MKIGLVSTILLAMLLSGCVESEFNLAQDSKLPKWLSLPEGIERKDIIVTLTYYTDSDVKISMHKQGGWFSTIQSVSGTSKWHPEYWAWAQEDWPLRSHPGFTVIEVKGSSEIIEHKTMEPVFYVSSEKQVQNVLRTGNTFNK